MLSYPSPTFPPPANELLMGGSDLESSSLTSLCRITLFQITQSVTVLGNGMHSALASSGNILKYAWTEHIQNDWSAPDKMETGVDNDYTVLKQNKDKTTKRCLLLSSHTPVKNQIENGIYYL